MNGKNRAKPDKGAFKYYVSMLGRVLGVSKNADTADAGEAVVWGIN